MPRYPTVAAAWCLAVALMAGCAAAPQPLPPLPPERAAALAALLPADALLLGEQHDANTHQQLERQTVQWLVGQDQLAALVIEMAEQGHHTRSLPPTASEADVRAALAWADAAWPWSRYGPVVMTAVRAGVPVLGGNLPRAQLRQTMADARLDTRLPPAALAAQRARIHHGHCGRLPESQLLPMARVQIARDIHMASTLLTARQPGRTVLLVAGQGHVERRLGVPVHLPENFKSKVLIAQSEQAQAAIENKANMAFEAPAADLVWPTPALPPHDYCADFDRANNVKPRASQR
ncbi:ChaN family lipoprotein [Ottowia sp.]|uniref:ChaN family lipoprotein n=1 Tax=Ottowia sp. TaxID=1898956 RepID=UPI003A8AD403